MWVQAQHPPVESAPHLQKKSSRWAGPQQARVRGFIIPALSGVWGSRTCPPTLGCPLERGSCAPPRAQEARPLTEGADRPWAAASCPGIQLPLPGAVASCPSTRRPSQESIPKPGPCPDRPPRLGLPQTLSSQAGTPKQAPQRVPQTILSRLEPPDQDAHTQAPPGLSP